MNALTVKSALTDLLAAELAEDQARLAEFAEFQKTKIGNVDLMAHTVDASERRKEARAKLELAILALPTV